MRLDEVLDRKIPYAIATDVGASPTVSMLAEMRRFMQVHGGISSRATAAEALCRATLAPADLLGMGSRLGRLEAGMPMSFIEVESSDLSPARVIESLLPENPDQPAGAVNRVTIAGKIVFEPDATAHTPPP
jgi:cytosine/adenosine deaminase-related metal-dependent hydrolase